jgi:hypothetical protein
MSAITSQNGQHVEPSGAHLDMSTQKVAAIVRAALRKMLARGVYEKVEFSLEIDVQNGCVDLIRTSYVQRHKPNSAG